MVDDDAAVLLRELLADQTDRERRFLVEQAARLRLLRELGDLLPLRVEAQHVALELVFGRAFGRGAHDQPGVGRPQAVEHPAQALALVVGQALRDAVRLGLAGNHHDEAAREADLLGEARALVPDRVLRDLHDDRLAVAQHTLDARPLAAFDVARVVRDVAAVQHAVLGRADVDERGFHARQHVLHATEVDVAVDRRGLVGRASRRSARSAGGLRARRCARCRRAAGARP